MKGWLFDTNVLSELRRVRPAARVVGFVASCQLERTFISEATVAEVRYGMEIATDPEKRAVLDAWIEGTLRTSFAGRILPLDEDVLVRWIGMVEDGRKRRLTFSHPDSFIAATALVHDLTIVTRNTADFERTGARVVDPWSASASP